eukprot:Polyplicarium_translucidae@DN1148_c0_g1_i1.p1
MNGAAVEAVRVAAACAGVAAVWWLTRGKKTEAPIGETAFVELLDEIAKRFFPVLTKLARVSSSCHETATKKGLAQQLTVRQLETALFSQGFEEQFSRAESEALVACGHAPGDAGRELMRQCSNAHGRRQAVTDAVLRVETMYAEALAGELPVFPGLSRPPALTQDRVLEMLGEIHTEKQRRFVAVLGEFEAQRAAHPNSPALIDLASDAPPSSGSPAPQGALAGLLTEAARAAEDAVLVKRAADIAVQGYEPSVIFHNALALHCRDPTFVPRKFLQDQIHTDSIMTLLKERPPVRGDISPEKSFATPPSSPPTA